MASSLFRIICLTALLLLSADSVTRPAGAVELPPEIETPDPTARERAGPRPDILLDRLRLRTVPNLAGEGAAARRNALSFLEWASSSTMADADLVRKALTEARDNEAIVRAFCEAAFRAQGTDHSRALVALALLGEMQSPSAEDCLARFVEQPLPVEGTMVEGEILEQEALATLQAKAIDGLAFLDTPSSDERVLQAVAQHPSRIVRAEAIAAYLWNHDYSEEARRTLRQYVREDEVVFLDRIVRRAGETAESFNPRLDDFLQTHPELQPPAPGQNRQMDDFHYPSPPRF